MNTDNNDNNKTNEFSTYKKLGIAGVLLFIISIIINNVNTDKRSHSKSESAKDICNGTETCITKVRENFNNTGKTILGEEYLGNGKFGISFMDYQHAGSVYNATVITDCNCTVLDVNISTAR